MMRVKICGITNISDAEFCVEHGADALGFVFYKKSPRYITPLKACEIIKRLPPFVMSVGLFVNETKELVNEISKMCGLDILQFHGDEPAEYVNGFSMKTIKAFRVKDTIDESTFKDYDVSAYLLDAYTSNLYGGSGESFSWDLLSGRTFSRPVILAGGLTVDNVADAVKSVKPYAVDVSSGVEREKGVKDHEKVKKFIIRAKHGRYEE
ncbi:phosphoribosylanthranilate isomerase [Thermodesulfobacteriota bacterium]